MEKIRGYIIENSNDFDRKKTPQKIPKNHKKNKPDENKSLRIAKRKVKYVNSYQFTNQIKEAIDLFNNIVINFS